MSDASEETKEPYLIRCFCCEEEERNPAYWCMPCKCVLCRDCFTAVVQHDEVDGERTRGVMVCPHGVKIERVVLFDRGSGKVLLDGGTMFAAGYVETRIPKLRQFNPMEDWTDPWWTDEEDLALIREGK